MQQARNIKTHAAVHIFRGGEVDTDELARQLKAAEVNQDVIDAIVSRELAKAQVKADAEMAKLAAQIEKEALKAS